MKETEETLADEILTSLSRDIQAYDGGATGINHVEELDVGDNLGTASEVVLLTRVPTVRVLP